MTNTAIRLPRSATVVVCTHDMKRWERLAACVAALRRQTRPPDEILVVVDHNPPLEERARHELEGVRVLPNRFERGLGGARNTGIGAARGDVVAFMDDDAVADERWLEQLLAGYTEPRVLGVGGRTEPDWEGEPARWLPEEFYWVVGCAYKSMPESMQPVRNVHGGNSSFRREAIARVDGFRLGYSCDDTEFCIRLQRHHPGGIVMYQPAARMGHYVPAARLTWRYYLRRCYFEGGSKAVVARLAGADQALETERAYVRRTLPLGVMREVCQGVRRRDGNAFLRASAIILGLGATALGYVVALPRLTEHAHRRGWVGDLPERPSRAA